MERVKNVAEALKKLIGKYSHKKRKKQNKNQASQASDNEGKLL